MNNMNILRDLALYINPKFNAMILETCLRWVSKQHSKQANIMRYAASTPTVALCVVSIARSETIIIHTLKIKLITRVYRIIRGTFAGTSDSTGCFPSSIFLGTDWRAAGFTGEFPGSWSQGGVSNFAVLLVRGADILAVLSLLDSWNVSNKTTLKMFPPFRAKINRIN